MTWPELEIWLSEQEVFDLIDEFADEPQGLPPEIRALRAAGTGAWAPGDRPGPATFTKPATAPHLPVAVTPRPLGASSRLQSGPRGVRSSSRCQCVVCDRGRQWLDGRSCGGAAA